ncbi:MAG: hypothetical protein AB8G05_19855 [Oligoflexales bacterium]
MNHLKLYCGVLLVFAVARTGQSYPKQPESHYRACMNKKREDACSVKIKEKMLNGTCKKDLESKIFCYPKSPKSNKAKK